MTKLIAYLFIILAYQCTHAQTYIKGPALIQTPTQTTTSGGSTLLTKDSQTIQVFVGSSSQTVQLPDATTLPVGRSYQINNRSTQALQVNYGDGSAAFSLLPNSSVDAVLVSNTLDEGTWDLSYVLGALAFVLDGDLTSVSQDTGTPANSTPLPARILNPDGTEVTFPTLSSGNVPVTVSNFPATQPVSGTVTANQGGSWTVAATQSGTWNINNISGTVSLPTGAATSANQTTTNNTLATIAADTTSIDGKTPNLGQAVMNSSVPVAIAQDQSAVPVSFGTPSAGTITQAAVTVGTSAVRMTVSGSAPSSGRIKLLFQPISTSTATFYLGASSVTSSGSTRGIQVFPGQTVEFNNDANDYYLISNTAGQTVLITEVN